MRVKRYIVETMPDAMQKIRTELGKDAVILSTKEMKVGGFLGLFQKKKIEVIAATETTDSAQQPAESKPRQAAYPTAAPVARASVPAAYRKSAQILTEDRRKQPPAVPSTQPLSVKAPSQMEAVPEEFRSGTSEIAAEALMAERHEESKPMVQIAARDGSHLQSSPAKEDKLLEEIRQMKAMMTKLTAQGSGEPELPEPLLKVQHRLLEQGVSSELAEEWISNAFLNWTEDRPMEDQDAFALIREQVRAFLNGRVSEGISDSTKIVYIAGPTGVGKTTTIAKLAADQIFRKSKKVGFITADTYRISAIEQLRTYASILNVPIEVVQSPGDVHRAVQRFQHCDLVIMDTAGRNYLNELFVAELHSLLSTDEQSETYLVLSLTSKSQDMMKITENFSRYGLDKVIFTKLDETESCGSMFNLVREYPMEFSYLTNGQNVPDDLLMATPELLIEELLGERSE
ncbi:flagellar biosynthesis protein FlhF [Paenibacillus tuaregi]|uniref:flagellar biosynthesis protein FlhF n=1 Tax=Paenibacillus tuaregi TaxID=1816681 RepID=UPI000838D3AF|nr:flagellar biosynthesis protein FlhF [Paenibacillus tuaregi]